MCIHRKMAFQDHEVGYAQLMQNIFAAITCDVTTEYLTFDVVLIDFKIIYCLTVYFTDDEYFTERQ